jgi:hypothetical protein
MCTKFWLESLKGRDHFDSKMHLKEIGWRGVVWIHLSHDRSVGELL